MKVLGLKWDPSTDTFSFISRVSIRTPTKRTVLSDIERVFDPLGELSPITFWTKHIMQRLWTSSVKWNNPVPDDIGTVWTQYQSEFQSIEKLAISRRLTYDYTISLQLHAFSDSSKKDMPQLHTSELKI